MAWVYLVIAGVMEVFWSTCLKLSEGFTVLKFTVLTIVGMVVSFLFKESITPARCFFILLLLVGIMGLKATSGH